MKKIAKCLLVSFLCIIPINTFAENQGNDKDYVNVQERIEPRIYTTDVEQSCEVVQYNGYDETTENCTYRKLNYWNGYNKIAHRGREITTAQDKVNGYRRFLYTYTYETY